MEEAREKIYQDLVDKGDLEGAKAMRAYQDVIHPVKSSGQSLPKSPTQPSPASTEGNFRTLRKKARTRSASLA
jgi:polyhydroxyalkanoate synthesis regulator phasin